jgi:hypothetical protein
MHEDFVRAMSTPEASEPGSSAPGVVLTDLPDDVTGVADAIVAAVRSGRTRYAVTA